MRRRAGIVVGVVVLVAGIWLLAWSRAPGGASGETEQDGRRVVRTQDGATDPSDGQGSSTPSGTAPAEVDPDGEGAASADTDVLPEDLTDAQLAARAKELAESPTTHVICDLGFPVRAGAGYLAVGGHSDMNGRMVEVIDGKAYLPLVYDLGEMADVTFDERAGVFALEGYGPTEIAWSDRPEDGGKGRCTATKPPEPGRASLTGMLTLEGSGQPAAGGWVEGCGNLAHADGHGVVHMDIVSSPCTVIAMRQDGGLRTMSAPVEVVPVPGKDVVVDFTLPSQPKAGLGVQIASTEAGMRIEGVIDGGAADAAGLEAGDLVVEIDGQSTVDLPIEELVDLVGGPEGSEVVLSVERDGVRLELTVVRAPVPG